MEATRIGVIGVGGMGAFHARTLAGLSAVEVVAVADPLGANRAAVAADVGCDAFADADDVLALDLDGVVIASPDETHAELTLAALALERFVLCEKPLAVTLDGADRIIAAEVDLGRRLVQLGFMREYDPAHVQLLEAIGTCGRIDHLRALHRNAHDQVRPLERIVRQSMVHDVHSVRFLTGAEITEVTAFGSTPVGDSFRYVTAVCRLDTGGHAVLEFDDVGYAYEVSVEVIGADGDAITGYPPRVVTRHGGSIDEFVGPDWFARFGEAYAIQDLRWVESIRAGIATGPSAWDGRVAESVVAAILTSFEEDRTVGVPSSPDRPSLY